MLKRTPLKRGIKRIRKKSNKQLLKDQSKAEETKRMFSWFLSLWDAREETDRYGNQYVSCFESGKRLYRDNYRENSCCYDHVLEKSSYPQYKFTPENIIIISPEIHAQKGSDISKTPKILEYHNYLLDLYKSGKLREFRYYEQTIDSKEEIL